MKSHFHIKGWAPRLALRKRLKVIRKWPLKRRPDWSLKSKLNYSNPLSSRMIPYGCLSTGSSIGMIEVVHDAETIAKLQKNKGVAATFAKNCIWDWLKEYHATEERCVLQCLH